MRRFPRRPDHRPAGLPRDQDRRRALALVPVSRETEQHFATYVDLLGRWQVIKNLVAPSTLPEVWTRHIADSAQLLALAPTALRWLDLGSGAGFPGLVVAIMLAGRPGARVHLVESNGRKCAFLREVARATSAPAEVHNARLEAILPTLEDVDVVTARALAPLPVLMEMGKIPLGRGASGMFLKSDTELADTDLAGFDARVSIERSRTSEHGRIVVIRSAAQTSSV